MRHQNCPPGHRKALSFIKYFSHYHILPTFPLAVTMKKSFIFIILSIYRDFSPCGLSVNKKQRVRVCSLKVCFFLWF